ncbi:MAG: hypothetical protein GVY18_16635 [Bacteroidetes bacterium]|jgi:hypothetical protein|nr:hypothetical protein [Bacteroidota bacterium]
MKRTLSFAFILALLLPLAAMAQRGTGRMNMDHRYDPAAEETVEGTVEAVELMPAPRAGTGVHLQLRTEDGLLPVHLGPSWYITNQDVQIDEGDAIEVVGARITVDGAPALIAGTIRRGDGLLVLRDEAGFPAWRGWRQGQRGGRGMGPGRGRGAGRGMGPGRMQGIEARRYDPSTVETLSGTVGEVQRLPMGRAYSVRLHLADDAAPTVILGPSWYLDNQDVLIPEGADVTITGSRVDLDGVPFLIAAEVTYGEQVLTLRDEAGFPVWSGWRQR